MISVKNLTPKDLKNIAEQLIEKGSNERISTIGVLVETSEYVKGQGDKLINQAIILCSEVEL